MNLSNRKNVKIVLFEGVHPDGIEMLKRYDYTNITCYPVVSNSDELISKIEGAHIVGIRSQTHLTSQVIQNSPHLMAIGCFCIGTNQVDLEQAMLSGIPVFNSPHPNTRSVAELVIGLTIMLLRNVFPKNKGVHDGHWIKSSTGSREVRGKKIGIVGYGNIGSQVSVLAESLGMDVFFYDVQPKLSLGNAKNVRSLEELLAIADVITLHVPETPETKNLMSREMLKKMKNSSCLINTSRGSVVDIETLAEMLQKKELKGAAIDVFPMEPKNDAQQFESKLRGIDSAILTPHIGGSTQEAQENIATEVALKLIDFISNGSTAGATNFPSLALPPISSAYRILHTHYNVPGMLLQINKAIAEEKINVISQYLRTNEKIGYVALDIPTTISPHLLTTLKNIEGTIRVRISH